MGNYKLTNNADKEMAEIYYHSVLEFGIEQARKYTTTLHQIFSTLSNNPRMGRNCNDLKAGCRRHEHKRHVIFYTPTETGVTILHVLGSEQDPIRHLN